jgi:hypothetical protein
MLLLFLGEFLLFLGKFPLLLGLLQLFLRFFRHRHPRRLGRFHLDKLDQSFRNLGHGG